MGSSKTSLFENCFFEEKKCFLSKFFVSYKIIFIRNKSMTPQRLHAGQPLSMVVDDIV